MTNSAYIEFIQQQRKERDEHMTANPRNWLTLTGLFWLEEGDNPFGRGAENKIVLPALPLARCGCLHLQGEQVYLSEATDGVMLNDGPVELRRLNTDIDERPDILRCDSVDMMVIRRGEHTLLRVWDRDAQAVKNFKGLRYFPIDETYRLPALFVVYDPPKTVTIHDAIGGQHAGSILGRVEFNLNGVECSLEVEDAEDEGLISFVDETRKDLSYPGGRYITLAKPIPEEVILDFNLAANWPCAYTSFATCPLTPFANHLPVRIEAGEMKYHE